MDPIKCFNSDASLTFDEGEQNYIFVDLTKNVALNMKLFEKCLKSVNIFNNNTEVPFQEVTQKPYRIKISSLNRLKNVTLTVEYHFQDGRRKTRNLFVPSSPSLVQQEIAKLEKEKLEREKLEELEKKNKSILIASIISGVLALILFLITIVCVCRKRVKPPKEEEYRTNENDIYGTYSLR